MARTGPRSAFVSWIFLEIAGSCFSAVRVIEIALSASEILPAIIARLLEEASQVKTSAVIASWNSALTNLIASSVCFELSVRLPAASCSWAPNAYMIVRIAMPVSISFARPMPTALLNCFLTLAPAVRTSSQVFGPLGSPTCPKRSCR